jgi:hypothetical protein
MISTYGRNDIVKVVPSCAVAVTVRVTEGEAESRTMDPVPGRAYRREQSLPRRSLPLSAGTSLLSFLVRNQAV